MSRTLEENTAALAAVRAAIDATLTAQDYTTALGQRKAMPQLQILFDREKELLAERAALSSTGSGGGLVVNQGIPAR